MKTGKKGRQAILHNSVCLLFASLQRLVYKNKKYIYSAFNPSYPILLEIRGFYPLIRSPEGKHRKKPEMIA